VLILANDRALSSTKAHALIAISRRNFPIPPTLIVPSYLVSDEFSLMALPFAPTYYVRLALGQARPFKSGRLVAHSDVQATAATLRSRLGSEPADLIVQPLVPVFCSGAAIKLDATFLVEAVFGAPPVLMRSGRFSYRLLYVDDRLMLDGIADQGVALTFRDGGVHRQSTVGWVEYRAHAPAAMLRDVLREVDNGIFEWGYTDSSIIIFDYRAVPAGAFPTLRGESPSIPGVVNSRSRTAEGSLLLEYPDLRFLDDAIRRGYVVIRKGAVLSHLSVYAREQGYGCEFATKVDRCANAE
jgi:hypothetical protein